MNVFNTFSPIAYSDSPLLKVLLGFDNNGMYSTCIACKSTDETWDDMSIRLVDTLCYSCRNPGMFL